MQYILTEEEYNNLIPKNEVDELIKKLDKANKRILEMTTSGKCLLEAGSYCDYCPINVLKLDTCIKYPQRHSK